MFPRRAILLVLLFAGCAKEKSKSEPAPTSKVTCKEATEVTGSIHWYEDDAAAAKACAKAKNLPLVIDQWAPWCHTCLSMKTVIFTDAAFAPFADRFVWLSTDTDKEINADMVATYTPAAWPTFWVIDHDGKVDGRFVGSASLDQFREFLTNSERTFLAGSNVDPKSADGMLVAAERLVTEASALPKKDPARVIKLGEAADAYEAALAAAPADWPRRPDVLVSAMDTISRFAQPELCLGFADKHLNETGNSSSATDFVVNARSCASRLAEIDPPGADAYRAKFIARLEQLVADTGAPMSADDRSDLLMNLRELYDDAGRPTDAVATAEKQRAMLDEVAAKAPSPWAAMTYNWPRSEVYAYLHKHDELIPALEKSAADLPEEYDPPYRLAWLYEDAGKHDEALAWAKKSVVLAYGPRKATVQKKIVDILRAKRDEQGELAARRELVAIYKSLKPGVYKPEDLEKAEVELAALEAVATPPTQGAQN